jgi:hypothetical protein
MGHRWWNKNDNAGTKASWEEFVDEGGITHQAQFYGLPVIIGAKAAYKIISFDIAVPQLVSPKTLRETLDGLCRSNTKDWQFPSASKSVGFMEKAGATSPMTSLIPNIGTFRLRP